MSQPPTSGRPWIGGPIWDSLWVLNGGWLLLLAWGLSLAGGGLEMVYVALTALFWLGHRFSSLWVAWGTRAYRPLVEAQRARFVYAPLAIAAAVFGWLMAPSSLIPVEPGARLVVLGAIDFVFITWHFSAQHFGVLRLYRVRAGATGGRRLDRLTALGLGGLIIVLAELISGSSLLLDAYPSWGPPWPGLTWARWALVSGVLALAWRALRGVGIGHRLYVIHLVSMALGALVLPPEVFLFAWTVQHWTVAVALGGRIAARSRRSTWGWWIGLMVVSTLALPWLELDVASPGEAYGALLFPTLTAWLHASPWVPVFVSLGFATGFMHYALDRAVFRLSDPMVREAASGLLRARS